MLKVVHVITCLDDGGAEAVLYRLVKSLNDVRHVVVSLSGTGKYGYLLREMGIEVFDLEMKSLGGKVSALFRLSRLIKKICPDVVQTWMYHADLIGGLAARLVGFKNVVWGLHNCMVGAKENTIKRYGLIRINALLSYFIPAKIVSCSMGGLLAHKSIGFFDEKLVLVHNGSPVGDFYPDADLGVSIRKELSVGENDFVIGVVARLDPQKDHVNLLDALFYLKKSVDFKCLLVGNGLGRDSTLVPEIEARGLGGEVVLAGQRSDIPAVMNAIDLLCLSSNAEAFPNVLCEAMACGKPCVATEVGDCSFIVGDSGWIVPPRSPKILAEALFDAIKALPDSNRSRAARQRIVENFTLERMAESYKNVWCDGNLSPSGKF